MTCCSGRSLMLTLVVVALAPLSACPAADADPAVARGRQAYNSTCTACHNLDPAMPGAVGPAIKGSSRALLEAKILRAEYPAGYAPQRDTKMMPAQPQMASAVDDLAAFLQVSPHK